VVIALAAGALYGVAFNPTQWLIDNRPDGPRQAIYYVPLAATTRLVRR
jgi:hypothetical protein